MAIKTTGASIITSKSAISSGLVIVNRPEGYVITGPRVESGTTFKKLVVAPGFPDNIEDITGGGGGNAPTITSIVVTDDNWVPTGINVIDSETGGYIEINGTGFDSGAIVYLNGEAITTTFVDDTKLRVVVPPTESGTYAIMVFNSDDAGTIFTNLTLSIAPTFITPAGSLGSFYETLTVTGAQANVRANSDSSISYTIFSGSLPAGLTLQSATGNIVGTSPVTAFETNYPFTVAATDSESQSSTRSFSITILPDLVTFINPEDSILEIPLSLGYPIANIILDAVAISETNITFSANILPSNVFLTGNLIAGTPNILGNITSLVTATAETNRTANVIIYYPVLEPFQLSNYRPIEKNYLYDRISSGKSIRMSADGIHFYKVNSSNDFITRYDLTVPFKIDTASKSQEVAFTNIDSNPTDVHFKPDGSRMYIAGDTNLKVFEFALTTPWDITTNVKIGELSTSSISSALDGLFFNDDGSKLYILSKFLTTDFIYELNLSTPWQANSATYSGANIGVDTRALNVTMMSDGKTLLVKTDVGYIKPIKLSTPWDITTGVEDTANILNQCNISSLLSSEGIEAVNGNVYIGGDSNRLTVQVQLQTANVFSNINFNKVKGFYDVTHNGNAKQTIGDGDGVYVSPDGTRMFITGDASVDRTYQFNLSTPYDITTAVYNSNLLTTSGVGSDLYFKPDGTKMYLTSTATDRVTEYSLSTPWQVNSAVIVGNVAISTDPSGITFKPDGTKMYVTKLSNDSINELNLSTPWQVNTAVQTSSVIVSATALGGENAPTGIDISDNGLVILVIGAGKDAIHQYNLSIPWQANTATYNGNTSISNRELDPSGINITKDGYYIYFIGDSQDYVWQYELGLLS